MNKKISANFIGPKGENISVLKELINIVIDHHEKWRRSFYKNDEHIIQPSINPSLKKELQDFLKKSDKNHPYFSPRYSAQMLKDPSIPTIIGYLSFMLSNPNNHAYEGGPVTTDMEMEVVETMQKMSGYKKGWGHLTSGGSLANLEALWAARDFYKKGAVYFSEVSHYSWKRNCQILGINNFSEIYVDKNFRIDLNHLEKKLKNKHAMFVSANVGSTGTGSVDDLQSLLQLKNKYNFHLHIDAAYGGFVRSLLLDKYFMLKSYSKSMPISRFVFDQLKAIKDSDSITIDPHKHGLISYGAGAVLFKNEKLRQIILNTSPYTYHQKEKPNIGMFSLEGSRPGAMAAACYLTYKILPPNETGVGEVIRSAFSASKKFYELIEESGKYNNLNYPDLDINCLYPNMGDSVEEINKNSLKIYHKFSVEAENPSFILSKFVMPPQLIKRTLPNLPNKNNESFTAIRSVFMKPWGSPKNFYFIKKLIKELEDFIL